MDGGLLGRMVAARNLVTIARGEKTDPVGRSCEMLRVFEILAVLCMVAGAAQTEDNANDLKLMQGTWSGAFIEAGGKPLPDKEKAVKLKLIVKADKYTVFLDEKKITEGELKLDASKKPRTIDALPADGPFKGMVQPGIYKIEGYEMWVLFSKPGVDRPTEFKTKEGTDQMLASYQRVKDGK
jgi:uncharacterized protein (TIGR03067 family)